MVSFLRHSLFALVLTVILSLVINFSLSRLVTKPIKNLALAMDKIRMSKAGKEIEVSADDEIGALARSFNQMSLALQEREEELQKYTTELEQMVDERTKKLKESQSHLIQTEKLASMGKLSGFIAHEINTPIGIIVSRIECILMDATGSGYPESLIKDIEILKKHSQRISDITNNILAFSRKSSVEFSATDINKVINDVLLFLEKQFSSQNVYFRKELNNNIPAIEGNANQLRQVLFNVLNNAKDAMPEGGEIVIKTQHAGDRKIKVLIIDSGVGIPEINLDKIFDPFFTTKEEGKGTGLGLSVVYGIIKDHNGEINIESKRGKGTTFEIQLPVNENHSLEA
jgi:signal transduction histidine kinase